MDTLNKDDRYWIEYMNMIIFEFAHSWRNYTILSEILAGNIPNAANRTENINNIAMGVNEVYKKMIQANGVVRDFYETLKIGFKSE